MASLKVSIDRSRQIASFSGSGTYNAREEIKRLGVARWDGIEKSWVVRSFKASAQELIALFDDVEITEGGGEQDVHGYKVALASVGSEADSRSAVSSRGADGGGGLQVGSSAVELPRSLSSALSVSELLSKVSDLLSKGFSDGALLYGVVSSIKRSEGRVFLQLVEPNEPDKAVDCVIWRDEAKVCRSLHQAGFELERDLQVMFRVKVALNPRGGRLSLTIVDVVAEYTILRLAALRELTNRRLIAEGIFELNKKTVLTHLPIRIGILTSGGGTVINDFRAALDQARFGFELLWLPIAVQGSDAKPQLLAGLAQLGVRQDLDLIVLFRGGGGAAELSVFNDYDVAKAICLCPLPVFCAVGHEADQSSAQDVSYRAFGVPKDIGRALADIVKDFRLRLAEYVRIVVDGASGRHQQLAERVGNLALWFTSIGRQMVLERGDLLRNLGRSLPLMSTSLLARAVDRQRAQLGPVQGLCAQRVELCYLRLQQYLKGSFQSGLHLFETAKLRLEKLEARVLDASPEVQLRRGFVLINSRDGRIVSRSSQLSIGDGVELTFSDGKRRAVIES